ncbi:MAG: anion permease [Candidatus Thiodiazotropha sp. (ex Lucinoma annulata)]|nr:anion permease [Candidatus Thiodiazotropha sp. (ex Lucinoma borealis)]MCU7869203.1 anion permease [Candidatus Thiodiazotropha sp. (ex Lucinoma borealis)]MCU7884023.1 anion permease [Candidatus Thiodiazotropha sp. (ex Lucinoma annulata)]
MTVPQIEILAVLVATVALFLWGRWRHDLVALAALMACVLLGLISADQAFLGFGHPAVITVACVLILSRGLQDTGAVDRLTRWLLPRGVGLISGIAALAGLGAALSAFMNNVGAMALLLPVALQLSKRFDMAPSRILMPLAFGTILGGMSTLIGTPPNLIVSGFREGAGSGSFGMFDFLPVGGTVALIGLTFLVLVGWRLVPAREKGSVGDFDTGKYLAEARVREGSSSIGKTLNQADDTLDQDGAQIVGLIRDDIRLYAPNPRRRIRSGDILVIEAEPDDLSKVISDLELSLGERKKPVEKDGTDSQDKDTAEKASGPIALQELAVLPDSGLIGRSSGGIKLNERYSMSVLAVSRQGRRTVRRVKTMRFKAGDLLLMQGPPEALAKFSNEYHLVPLADRDIRLPKPRKAIIATAIMVLSIGSAALGVLPASASFALGVLLMGVSGIIPPRDLYKAVDWPVIVLLASLIPVAGAMASTGTADLLANALLNELAQGTPVLAMVLLLVVTMTLSDFMNNAATAAVMCPIALSGAQQLGVSADPLLMAVAIGASCAFLTPIGHQNNTLILGPGGLKFGDYWRLGLPMEILVVVVSIPMLLLIWPL